MFKGNRKEDSTTNSTQQNTFIAPTIEISGNIKGEGAVQVEGILHGDLTVSSVVIGENGRVNGIINAKNVIINGELNGSLFADNLEVMKNGKVSNEVKVKTLHISGEVNGSIESSERITVDTIGSVNATSMRSKNIEVNGAFNGKIIASELLEIGRKGSVEGEITVKNIKTHEGGKLLGSMKIYENKTKSKKS